MKSLRYRGEYWQGAWGVITDGAPSLAGALVEPTFWWGVGPGNFAGPYVKYKLPEASEEIVDPHNLFLEVWATGGFCAFALPGWLRWRGRSGTCSGRRRRAELRPGVDHSRRRRRRRRDRVVEPRLADCSLSDEQDDLPPSPHRLAHALRGRGLGDGRRLRLAQSLSGRSLLTLADPGRKLAHGGPPAARHSGSGCPYRLSPWQPARSAMVVNLLAAGGIGIPTVALCLWSIDRPGAESAR